MDNAANNTKFISEFKVLMDQNGIPFNPEDQHFKYVAHIENSMAQDFFKKH